MVSREQHAFSSHINALTDVKIKRRFIAVQRQQRRCNGAAGVAPQ
ncbi:hypothetical protein [Enterobacter asburiae]|nr:hypothetical protein [Enterobacter asburiae]